MIKWLLCLLFISCASSRTTLPPAAEVITKDFSSLKEASNYIRNKHTYLTLLFEQSFDPYYGTPKWSQECLNRNTLSKIDTSHGNTGFSSQLILNHQNEPGFCEGSSKDVIFVQCKDSIQVHEIRCSPGDCQNVLNGNPCPLTK